MTLRPYQSSCVDAIEAGFKQFGRQLAVLPTGGGKTIIFSHLANRCPGRTLILAHRGELIEQAHAKLRSATGIFASIEKAESRGSMDSKVVIGSVQTLLNAGRRERWPTDHFQLVVVDEAHHALADSYRGILNYFTAKVLGVTATPDRGDKKNLGSYFQNVAFEISLFDLVSAKFLSPISVLAVPLRIDLSAVGSTAGDFREDELGSAIEPYLGQIAAAIKEHAGFRRTLAFLPLIATSHKFVDACRTAGLRAEHVDGQSPDRKQILQRYAGGEFDILSNAMLLTEGYDVDSGPTGVGIDCVVVLRPTRSRPLYAQMVGRGTRIAKCKENLLLLDFLWHHKTHRICRPAALIAGNEMEADSITELTQRDAMPGEVARQLDLQELAKASSLEREEALRKKLAAMANEQKRFISAEEFALKHKSLAVAEYQETMPWESEPVTAKQRIYLDRAKIDPSSVRGKGHASRLLGLYFNHSPLQLASEGQRALLRRWGYDNWETATVREASRIFAERTRSPGRTPGRTGMRYKTKQMDIL